MSKEFGWSEGRQGLVLSSFFYGYLSTQIIGGYLAQKFGGRIVLTVGKNLRCKFPHNSVGYILWTAFTILTPASSHVHFIALVFCRIFMGAGEGKYD